VQIGKPLGYTSVDDLDIVASGILQMATATMAGAIKEITIERGHDVREFDLFVFGGGGPLHGASLARDLHIPRVIVPPQPGNFSALGMLLAAARIDDTRTFLKPLDEASVAQMAAAFVSLQAGIRETLRLEAHTNQISFQQAAELRYRGQKHSLRLDIHEGSTVSNLTERFHAAYANRYGHSDANAAVEFVALKSTGYSTGDSIDLENLHDFSVVEKSPVPAYRPVYYTSLKRRVSTPVYARATLPRQFAAHGPAVIEDYGSTIVVEPDDTFEVGRLGEVTIVCG
jgi:N-methylhydantoinase A